MYGIELHRAKVCPLSRKPIDCNEFGTQDTNQHEIQIGVSGTGLSVMQNGVKVNQFSWAKIVKISFKRRHFFVQLRREGVCLMNESSLSLTLLSTDRTLRQSLGIQSVLISRVQSLVEELCGTAHLLQTPDTETAHKKVLLLLQSGLQIQIQVLTDR